MTKKEQKSYESIRKQGKSKEALTEGSGPGAGGRRAALTAGGDDPRGDDEGGAREGFRRRDRRRIRRDGSTINPHPRKGRGRREGETGRNRGRDTRESESKREGGERRGNLRQGA
ncbi:hypothetical protein C922_05094 [Plasmodium inui San Antonio 1]|uniref:Uncharacterized protein n=1 Tax=Plasmodium inui San Antonio 1 TaxID=1237626 RepID=W6ZUV3_9APIC|nr:hypothetical protein C922_05094 [Plasmodium inui San Antonio 1]EUD64532.1 hypothetical protein C922_05094 [Plasmodium inui San Antonio 1]